MADPIETRPVSRRTVLKGVAGVAGLATIPAIIAACSSSGASRRAERRRQRCRRERRRIASAAAAWPRAACPSAATTPTPASQGRHGGDRRGVHGRDRHRGRPEQGRPRHVPGPDHQRTSTGTPDTAYTWFSGFRMKFFADQGLNTPIDDVWAKVKGELHRRLRQLGRRQRRQGLRHPGRLLPVGRLLPQEPLRGEGLHGPHDLGRAQGPEHEDAGGRPHPDRLRRQGRLARDGHVRHPQPPDQRLRLPRRPDGRQGEVDRPEGHHRLPEVGGDRPLPCQGLRGPDVAERRGHARPEEVRACTCSACSSRRSSRRRRSRRTSTTSTSSRSRRSGPQFDAENALDAPIDTWQISSKSPKLQDELDAAKAYMEFWAKGSTQVHHVQEPAGPDPDGERRGHQHLQPAPEEGRGDRRQGHQDHPVPRPRHALRLRRAERHAELPAEVPRRTRPRISPRTRRPSRTSGTRCLRSPSRTILTPCQDRSASGASAPSGPPTGGAVVRPRRRGASTRC